MSTEFIRTTGLKGFRKSEIEIYVSNPEGKRRRILLGEIGNISRDRRKRKRGDYVHVLSLSREPRSDLTYNLATGLFSITFHQGFHHGYMCLKDEREYAWIAMLYLSISRSKRHILQKIGASYSDLPILSKWYVQQFRKKISEAQRKRFAAARRRRGRRT